MEKGIKNIIFDLGGIIVNLDRQRCVDSFKAIGVTDVSDYVDECKQEDVFHELEIIINRISRNARFNIRYRRFPKENESRF